MENLSLKRLGVVYRYDIPYNCRSIPHIYQIVQRDHHNEKKNMSLVVKRWNDIKLQVFHYFLPII